MGLSSWLCHRTSWTSRLWSSTLSLADLNPVHILFSTLPSLPSHLGRQQESHTWPGPWKAWRYSLLGKCWCHGGTSPRELCHSFPSTLNLLSVGRKAFTKLSEKGFVITSIRQAMACLFCIDSCKICLLGRIICFLPLRFTCKHTDEKCFRNRVVLVWAGTFYFRLY